MTSGATQANEEADFEELSGAPKENSVYDFLYQDVRRVGSFLAQFEEYGVRQAVKATESVGQTSTLKGAAMGTLGLPTVMGGSASVDSTVADETKDLAEHTFDPLWANARRLLDYIESGDHLETDLWEATIGSFVEIKGSISIVDLHYVQSILKNANLRRTFVEQFAKSKGLGKNSQSLKDFNNNFDLITSLPHGIQLTVYDHSDDESLVQAWSTISHESLTATAADLMLKHGVVLRGHSWRVIGILDALPDFRIPSAEDPEPKTLDEIAVDMIPNDFVKIAANLAAVARDLIGRPRTMFGVTPILIFREVKKGNRSPAGAADADLSTQQPG